MTRANGYNVYCFYILSLSCPAVHLFGKGLGTNYYYFLASACEGDFSNRYEHITHSLWCNNDRN
jgi:hypothetical protein